MTRPAEPPPPPLATPIGMLAWRPRTDDDQGLLRALFAASRRAELDLLAADPDQERAFVALQLRAREQHRDATRPGAELAVVTLDDVAVGQLDVHWGPESVELLEIAVVPGLRGHGLGTALVDHLVARADAAGLPVRLHVEPANPARRLYERAGFVPVAREAMHVLMERPAGGTGAPGDRALPPAAVGAAAAAAGSADDAPGFPDQPAIPTYADLAGSLGATVACLPDGPDLELVEVEARPRGGSGRVPYSALLAGPIDRPMPQALRLLDMPGTGPVELFIVPLAPRGGRAIYELVVR